MKLSFKMHRLVSRLIALSLLVLSFASSGARAAESPWRGWSDEAFHEAKRDHKLVILDLEAIWCHWCHVMHEKTYANPEIEAILASKFIKIRVDQDSRPDLANRYEDYGWPATIIFDSEGNELNQLSGFIAADEFKSILTDAIKGKKTAQAAAKPAVAGANALSDKERGRLNRLIDERYDFKLGGWDISHKFLDPDLAELLLFRMYLPADPKLKKASHQPKAMLKQILDAQLTILDPAWGGAYQYSAGGIWTEPHFEKIISVQADNVRIFSAASAVFENPAYLEAAKSILKYMDSFLSAPDGSYYTSQDADVIQGEHAGEYFELGDAQRRARGIPRVDQHRYARENGGMIQALTSIYSVTGEKIYLDRALKVADWALKNRALGTTGGFAHDEKDSAGPFLGDTLSIGQAFLRLYGVTGDRAWLTRAESALSYMATAFVAPKDGGYATAVDAPGARFKAAPLAAENVGLARFANLLAQITGRKERGAISDQAMRFVSQPDVASRFFVVSGALLADEERKRSPAHITLVAKKDDPQAAELWKVALSYPLSYRRTEWWDKREGSLANSDVSYPELSRAALFTCAQQRCSLPAFTATDAKKRLLNLKP